MHRAYTVLIPQDISRVGKEYLMEKGYKIKTGSGSTVENIIKDVQDCDAILARTAYFPAEVFAAGKQLKVISRHGIGVDNIDIQAATERGIYVTNSPLANTNSVAEHTIGFIIALAKNLVRMDKELKNGDFEIRNRIRGVDLENKRLGIVGLGRIGTLVGKKAAYGLGMKVIGYDPYINKDLDEPLIDIISDWGYLFENSDFISLHMPATINTKDIVGKKEFHMMKPTAYLINVSRGEIVNENDLIEALREGQIAGAALDVFKKEPPERDNPLFNFDNVIVSPHSAALTKEAMDRMGLHAAIGIHEVLSGENPSWPVNSPKLRIE